MHSSSRAPCRWNFLPRHLHHPRPPSHLIVSLLVIFNATIHRHHWMGMFSDSKKGSWWTTAWIFPIYTTTVTQGKMLALLSPISFYIWVTWCFCSLQAMQVKKNKKVPLQAPHFIFESNQIINATKNVCFNLLTLSASMATNNFSREVGFFHSLHLRSTGEQIAGKWDKILTFYEAQSNTTEALTGNICRLLSPNYVYSRLEKNCFPLLVLLQCAKWSTLKNSKDFLAAMAKVHSQLHTLGLYLRIAWLSSL